MRERREIEPLELKDAVKHVFEECRMVLPGIQALFGFQMIAVFNSGFTEKLSRVQQQIHGVAILLVILAIVFVMFPAALHRRAEPKSASDAFLRTASIALFAAMFLLALALALDVYIVTAVIWRETSVSIAAAISIFVVATLAWEGYPSFYRRRQRAP
jgi:hypothetical protein